jgi:CheY-like chemotaxis protein
VCLIPGMAPTPFTILVVDECPAVRLFVDLAVGSDAVRVVGAADGHAALASVERTRPDLVLAATGLTGLGGHDLAARLSSRDLPVVLVTGSLERIGAEEEAASAGALTKPLQVEHLRALVARMMAPGLTARPAAEPSADAVADEAVEADPIDAWLSEADSSLGMVPRQWRRLADETGDLHSFLRDVTALRSGAVTTQMLTFSRT